MYKTPTCLEEFSRTEKYRAQSTQNINGCELLLEVAPCGP